MLLISEQPRGFQTYARNRSLNLESLVGPWGIPANGSTCLGPLA